jgi:hypothetical protein
MEDVMPYVLHHISRSLAFDPERLSAMGDAYDRSVRSFMTAPGQPVREAIASHIIVLAERGVVDSATLCQGALAAFRQTENEHG